MHFQENPKPFFLPWVFALLATISVFTTDLYLVSFPYMQDFFSTSVFNIQLTLYVYFLGFSLSMIISAPLCDRFGYRQVILAGLTLYCAASLTCVFSTSISMMIMCRFLQSFGAGFSSILSRVAVRDLYERDDRVKLFVYLFVAMAVSLIVAPWLGSFFFLNFGWKANFLWMSCYSGVLLLAAYRTIPVRLQAKSWSSFSFRKYWIVTNNRKFLTIVFAIAFLWAGFLVFISKAPFIFASGQDTYEFVITYSFVIVGMIFGTLAARIVSNRLGIPHAIFIGICIALLGAITLAVSFYLFESTLAIAIPMFIYLLGIGIALPNCQAAISDLFDPTYASVSFSLLFFLKFFLGAVGGVFIAQMNESLHYFVGMICFCAAGAFIIWYLPYGKYGEIGEQAVQR